MVEPGEVSVWRAALRDVDLLRTAAACDAGDVAAVARLRKLRNDPAVVRAALAIVAARDKARTKFGATAERLWADVEGVEQATSFDAARPKAARFARALGVGGATLHVAPHSASREVVLDMGCGVGADAMALLDAGVPGVVAVDRDPVRAAMASANGGDRVRAIVADITTDAVDVRGRLIHLDPARRRRAASESRGRRTFALEDLEPGPAALRRLIERSAGAAVKLWPGMEVGEVREALGDGEACFTSEPAGQGGGAARRLTQATWFTGALRVSPAVERITPRRAVVVQSGGRWRELAGEPVDARELQVAKLGRFLVVPDPAVERAELLHALGMPTLWPGLGLLTGDVLPGPGDAISGLYRAFEVVAEMPWRDAKVRAWLAERGGVVSAVKTRGRACDPDAALRSLNGGAKRKTNAAPPSATFVVFVLRLGTPVVAIVTRPTSGGALADDAA